MTAHLDSWASTDHDPTSHTEAKRHLTLVTAPPQPAETVNHTHSCDVDTGSDVDELAVLQVAHDGLRLRLRGADRDEAVRRMHGRVDVDLIAWRLFTTTRTVHRVASRLGLTGQRPARGEQARQSHPAMAY